MSSLEPGHTLSHFRLLEKVGEGGMGVVWKALDTSLGREVALKLLPDSFAQDPAKLARLGSEAKTIATLNHPHIVTLYSLEEVNERRFLSMEFVSGRTLAELIPADGLSFEELMRIAVPVADAVSAAHRRGIVHRDLKPRNIMLDGEGRVKVLDFGLAQSPAPLLDDEVSDRTTRTLGGRALSGTLAYMSPEQLQGEPTDPRTDVFSLGVVLYEMATGRRPFQARSAAEQITAILRDAPVPPSRLRAGLPGRFDRLIARCLEKDPRYRLQSAVDLGWELEQLQAEAHQEKLRAVAVLPFVHGSVRKLGERLRVAVELVNVADGFEIWTELHDRSTSDVFAVQDEIARRVVEALGVPLSESEHEALGRPAAADVQAFDYYFYRYSSQSMRFARELFERATTLDPGYARAWSGIADCCASLYLNAGRHACDLEQADAASRRALELDAGLAEAQASRGTALSIAGRHAEAEQAFEAAIRLDPELLAGAHAEALDCLERALRAGMRNREWLEHDSNLDSIRQHPRFAELMQGLVAPLNRRAGA